MTFCTRKTQEDVNAEWNSMAGEWDDVASEYSVQFHDILWDETQLNPHQSLCILDFGCGTGLLVEHLLKSSPKSKFVCIDAAEEMMLQLQHKIQAREWTNVDAFVAILGRYDDCTMDKNLKEKIDSMHESFDLIVASSVMSFIPAQDMAQTIEVLGKLLKPGGIFCHSDWPETDLEPDGFTVQKAENLYRAGGLQLKSHAIRTVYMSSEEGKIFVGVAYKDAC